MVYLVAKNTDFMERWEATYYESSLGGREEIFSTVAEMILEKPLLGWQTVNWFHELGQRIGGHWAMVGRDAHNLLLALFLEVGYYRRNSLRGWTMVVRESGMEGARGRSGAAPVSTSEYRTCLWHVREHSPLEDPVVGIGVGAGERIRFERFQSVQKTSACCFKETAYRSNQTACHTNFLILQKV